MKITRLRLYVATTLLWAVFMALSWWQRNPFELLNIIGFGALVTIPGLLTVLGLKFGRALSFWHRLGQAVGLSLLEILLWVLACNTVLPHLHVRRPLDHQPLLIELSALYTAVAAWNWRYLRDFSYQLTAKHVFKTRDDVVFGGLALLFVLLAVTGAVSLNNGGSDVLTLTMLIGMSGYMGWLLLWRKRLHDNTLCWAIYLMALSLLLMTSLRGWYTTGHDIQREFQVFEMTKRAGVWNIAHLRDPYYACLSITILPTILSNTLHFNDPYAYKVFSQLIFAVVPVLIYLLMRRYLSKAKAFLTIVYFIAFPTYFTDMPFLNRQELAFLFVALMLLIIYDKRIAILKRRWLFISFGLGMIVSHYSTTYSWLFILLMAALMRPAYNLLVTRFGKWRLFRGANIADFGHKLKPTITVAIVVMLGYLCFVWNSVLTDTSNAATGVIASTISSITGSVKDDVRSSDVSYSLFSPPSLPPAQELTSYNSSIVDPLRRAGPATNFYPQAVVQRSRPTAVPVPTAPLTAAGRSVSKAGLNVGFFNYLLKQASAKLLQVFVVIGLVYTLLRRRLSKPIEAEFLLLTVASLLFVLLQVGLPYLSEAYGLLRAFQQALMVLGLFLVVGTFALTAWSKHRLLRNGVPAALALIFFLASTGVVSQLLGGYQTQLHLNNSGQYYDLYYTHPQEIAAVQWLNGAVAHTPAKAEPPVIQADSFTFGRLVSYTSLQTTSDIYPGMIMKNSYVYLGYYNTRADQSAIFFDGDTIAYTYPMQLLNQQKNLLYSNGGAEIYR